MKIKKRLDVLLTERLYADSRSKAQAIIMSGNVYVNGQKADKPGMSVAPDVEIEVRGKLKKYKGRLLLPISGLYKERNIDFGPVHCHNVIIDAPKKSMVGHYFGLIGTNKKSILTTHLNNAFMEHKNMLEQLEQIKTKIDNLTSMLEMEA